MLVYSSESGSCMFCLFVPVVNVAFPFLFGHTQLSKRPFWGNSSPADLSDEVLCALNFCCTDGLRTSHKCNNINFEGCYNTIALAVNYPIVVRIWWKDSWLVVEVWTGVKY